MKDEGRMLDLRLRLLSNDFCDPHSPNTTIDSISMRGQHGALGDDGPGLKLSVEKESRTADSSQTDAGAVHAVGGLCSL